MEMKRWRRVLRHHLVLGTATLRVLARCSCALSAAESIVPITNLRLLIDLKIILHTFDSFDLPGKVLCSGFLVR